MPSHSLPETGCHGWCRRCQRGHSLGSGRARQYAELLMTELAAAGRIDLVTGAPLPPAAELSLDCLFGDSRGQMFGVLECVDSSGATVVLRAYSAMFNGTREVAGWAPPLLQAGDWTEIVIPGERAIKALTEQLAALPRNSDEWLEIHRQRKAMSQTLMTRIHGMYQLHNFRGESRALPEVFAEDRGIPGGVGDCCAPKLLDFAARNELRPVGIAEFYWGASTKSGSRDHRQFYPCCDNKCRPILGFMLCGLDEND